MPLDNNILGHGVYTPREAARLVGTSAQHVLRWTRGSGPTEPLWNAHFQFLDDDVTDISFLDLIEIRVVSELRRAGTSLQSIRYAINLAREKYDIERPLASEKFYTDGTEILMDAVENDGELVSLSKNRPTQKVFRILIDQSVKGVEYENQLAARWRPENHEAIIIDPKRHFGTPLVDEYGISTSTLYQEFKHFDDIKYLASMYEIPKQAIKNAISFEQSLDTNHGSRAA